jgi:hypothetical protein
VRFSKLGEMLIAIIEKIINNDKIASNLELYIIAPP